MSKFKIGDRVEYIGPSAAGEPKDFGIITSRREASDYNGWWVNWDGSSTLHVNESNIRHATIAESITITARELLIAMLESLPEDFVITIKRS